MTARNDSNDSGNDSLVTVPSTVTPNLFVLDCCADPHHLYKSGPNNVMWWVCKHCSAWWTQAEYDHAMLQVEAAEQDEHNRYHYGRDELGDAGLE